LESKIEKKKKKKKKKKIESKTMGFFFFFFKKTLGLGASFGTDVLGVYFVYRKCYFVD
jgi:hypothetical protein